MGNMPRVTVVCATYNRSNVLIHSIESLIRSTFSDWRLLVVGDACTDDTASIVASFNDPRIRFVNLEKNFGEQSRPNNIGAGLADTPYVAFLNHDDLYFPDHLDRAVAHIESTGADLVFSAVAVAEPRTPEELRANKLKFTVVGVSPEKTYQPFVFAPASGWLLRRGLVHELGGWRAAHDCFLESSQDFLFRAWRAGKHVVALPAITVLAVQSGKRKDSYKRRDYYENAHYAMRMSEDSSFRENMLASAALQSAREVIVNSRKMNCSMAQLASTLFYQWICRLGVHPRSLTMALRYGRGGWIRTLRRVRGLE